MSSIERMTEFLTASMGPASDDQWRSLSSRYKHIRDSIDQLGGALGCEEQSARLWSELEDVFHVLAKIRARSIIDVAQKIRAALDMLDEGSNNLVRNLLTSALDDLAVQFAAEDTGA